MAGSTIETLPAPAAEYIRDIDNALEAYMDSRSDCPDRLLKAMRYSLMAGGKRLRPLLVLLAARVCGSETQAAMPAACAIEMIHTYSLIHDDLPAMDDDDMRRGQPSCHAAFDEATAILAGDALLTLAFEIMANDIQPPATAAACCGALALAAGDANMVGGQADDLAQESAGPDVDRSLEMLESIHRRKTGAMLTTSLRLGGLVAGADEKKLEQLDDYGRNLGLAFQIVDDLLDCQGDESQLGKRTQKDSERGKLTFPSLLGVDASKEQAAGLIARATGTARSMGEHGEPLVALAEFVLNRNR